MRFSISMWAKIFVIFGFGLLFNIYDLNMLGIVFAVFATIEACQKEMTASKME